MSDLTFVELAEGVFAARLFSARESEAILAIAQRRKWHKARVGNKVGDLVKREVRSAGVLYDRDIPQLAAFIRRRVLVGSESFSARLGSTAPILDGLQIIRYRPGGFYATHKDNPGGERDNRRQVTVVVYLNEDFRGGGLVFTKLDYTFTPRTGHVLLFPSHYPHKAETVVEGIKYIIATWYLAS